MAVIQDSAVEAGRDGHRFSHFWWRYFYENNNVTFEVLAAMCCILNPTRFTQPKFADGCVASVLSPQACGSPEFHLLETKGSPCFLVSAPRPDSQRYRSTAPCWLPPRCWIAIPTRLRSYWPHAGATQGGTKDAHICKHLRGSSSVRASLTGTKPQRWNWNHLI